MRPALMRTFSSWYLLHATVESEAFNCRGSVSWQTPPRTIHTAAARPHLVPMGHSKNHVARLTQSTSACACTPTDGSNTDLVIWRSPRTSQELQRHSPATTLPHMAGWPSKRIPISKPPVTFRRTAFETAISADETAFKSNKNIWQCCVC